VDAYSKSIFEATQAEVKAFFAIDKYHNICLPYVMPPPDDSYSTSIPLAGGMQD